MQQDRIYSIAAQIEDNIDDKNFIYKLLVFLDVVYACEVKIYSASNISRASHYSRLNTTIRLKSIYSLIMR